MIKIRDLKPDLVVWTGDTIPHNFWEHNAIDTIKGVSQVTYNVMYYLKGIPVYPVPGNHDFYPTN